MLGDSRRPGGATNTSRFEYEEKLTYGRSRGKGVLEAVLYLAAGLGLGASRDPWAAVYALAVLAVVVTAFGIGYFATFLFRERR